LVTVRATFFVYGRLNSLFRPQRWKHVGNGSPESPREKAYFDH
jgi:hypothetical protein